MALRGRLQRFDNGPASGGNRRIFLLATHPGEGLLTEPTGGAQRVRRELVILPPKRSSARRPASIPPARPLLTRAVAIGDCHGQELNRRNLHDPALSPAQVEPRPRGLAVARRQTTGFKNGIPDWKSVSMVRRARKYPRAPHAGLPRRSHASRYRPHTNEVSLPAHVGPGERARCGRRRSSETPDRTP
jgi:hypothetical protein